MAEKSVAEANRATSLKEKEKMLKAVKQKYSKSRATFGYCSKEHVSITNSRDLGLDERYGEE